MASATVDSAAASPTDGGFLRLDSIPIVDLRHLSQSELYSLSRCSSSASDPNRRDDVVIPIIDRSIFNESAGSRKQIYSRVRLAPADSSSSATPRCRTPHLRSTATAYGAVNSKSDPENFENHQIISLLKQFFVADMDPADLFPVKIEYSNSLPAQQILSSPQPPPPSAPSNAAPVGIKRKRGRPRRTDFLGKGETLAVEVSVINASDVGSVPLPSLNQIEFRDNEEEKDREVLNSDGVAVDLTALGAVEHPYWEEIRRRTEGLETEEKLLGFLTGLNGKWGSRRMKKRIVDANEFGSKLPLGWKLLLSVKKKNGHVWLYCRRYISPSGLHFVSCRGVSSYLLSLHGMQDTNIYSTAQYNDIVNDADKLISVPLAIQDEMENLVYHESSLPLDLENGNHEIRVATDVGSPVEVRIGEGLSCNQCNITFNEKAEFLHHQSSLHPKNKNKNVTRITDGVIIKDGKYECQFCHKTFSERHRYNGHVGTHVRFQAKMPGESAQFVYPASFDEFPTQDIAVEASPLSNNAMEVCNSVTNNGLNTCSLRDNSDDHFGDLDDASENMRRLEKAPDIVVEKYHCSVPEALFSSNDSKSLHEDACRKDSATELSRDSSNLQEVRTMESSLSHIDAADIDMNSSGIDNSASTEKPEEIIEPKSCLLDSNDHVEECPQQSDSQHRNDDHSNQKMNELKLDSQKPAVNESIFDLFGTREDRENNLAVSIEEKSDLEYLPTKDISITEGTSTSGSEAFKHENIPNISMLPIPEEEKACGDHNLPYATRLGLFSPFASTTDKQLSAEDNMIAMFNDTMVERREDPSQGILLNQSGISEVPNEAFTSNKVYTTPANPSEHNGVENAGKHELSLSFGSIQTDMCAESSRVEHESYQSNHFNVEPVVHKTYGDTTLPGILEQGSHFGFSNISFNDTTDEPEIGFNASQQKRHWDGTRGNEVRTSSHNFMVGFGNNNLQSSEFVSTDGSWRTERDNVFGGCYDANSAPQIQSSNFFHNFGLAPNKVSESSFGVNQNYSIQSDMMRPGRAQPVEYSFMGDQRVNSLHGEPKIFPYDTNMEQGMDPSFWLGKDALMPNTSHASQATSVCVYCRNVFFHDPVQAGIQTGSIGTICPSCSRIPGQFHVL